MLYTGIPFVLIDNYVLGINAVLGNYFEGSPVLIEYFIRMGHHQIAFIGGPLLEGNRSINKIYTIEHRARGYRLALQDAALSVPYDLYESADLTKEGGYIACKRLLKENKRFSALFCATDEMAVGAMKALHEANLHIPDDVSLVGFDDIDIAEHLVPAHTTVRANKTALGSTAVKCLLSLMLQSVSAGISSIVDVELVI